MSLPGDDEVLARVNGSPITRYDVERASRDLLGATVAKQLGKDAEKRMLQSLVEARAIAQAREKELTPKDRVELERKIAAYREELLVKQFLVRHTPPGAVSDAMVREYYEANKAKFGGATVRSYELLTAQGMASPAQRTAVLAALSKAGEKQDWAAFATDLRKRGVAVGYRSGRGDEAILHPKLAQLIAQVSAGQTSALTLIDGNGYVARVTAITEQPPKPLAEVREQIKRTLAPVKLKEAVKQASDQVLAKAEVAYR